MRNDSRILDLLACPICDNRLVLEILDSDNADGHILTGSLDCQSCSVSYPIIDGVPHFAGSSADTRVSKTVNGFGHQWSQANQLVQSTRLSANKLFLDFIEPVKPEYFLGKVILDGGCGQGRFTKQTAEFGAELVVGVDLSKAVDAAFTNTRNLPNVCIVQADLLNLPFNPLFDYAYSVGVLHHTTNPPRAFASIASCIKNGGGMSAWVYGRENNDWLVHVINPIRKHITSHLPRPLLWVLSNILTIPLYLLTKLIYLPINRSVRLHNLKKFIFYFDYLCWLGSNCGFREQALVVFDHLVPNITEYILQEEFIRWFEDNHLKEMVITSKANNSWRGFGIRTQANNGKNK